MNSKVLMDIVQLISDLLTPGTGGGQTSPQTGGGTGLGGLLGGGGTGSL
ncbi:hypothetical protein G4X40_01495 [Rhodococcus sp. D2-41]|uniref:Uncharacterized protein n=1 Tax=Speluncibacter jeojiensis TaxID=2710754 RepID=A0A9X4LVF3_9ACTN|nr:hypothetical protein [Rhodococcus sp. D2-41]MDG3008818.1 hypothetical protein [Rhodococcus sp. D2-41]MDG3012973.1 hypothetical protein [Corynebacteriales bacterium D3-21]